MIGRNYETQSHIPSDQSDRKKLRKLFSIYLEFQKLFGTYIGTWMGTHISYACSNSSRPPNKEA